MSNAFEVFVAFLKLGLSSFGGPIAHLGYFRVEFVERRKWLSDRAYADLVALAQFLPGPASSQAGFAIGLMRAGYLGGVAAWLGFTLPSAVLMIVFAQSAGGLADTRWGLGLLHGLKLVAVAIVAQAVVGMVRNLCPDKERATIAVVAIVVVQIVSGSLGQIAAILTGGLAGLFFCRSVGDAQADRIALPSSRRAGALCLALFVILLALAFAATGKSATGLFGAFYRSGALVFGGGHVVLPLLRDAVVTSGWVSDNAFLAGYGAAQALPGPLFTFSAYLGDIVGTPSGRLWGALIALVAIFLPGILVLLGALPFWRATQALPKARAALHGVNAAVVGLLAAALYDPVWKSAVGSAADFAIVAAAFALLVAWRAPPLLVVIACAMAGVALR